MGTGYVDQVLARKATAFHPRLEQKAPLQCPMINCGSSAWHMRPEILRTVGWALARMAKLVLHLFVLRGSRGLIGTSAPVCGPVASWRSCGATDRPCRLIHLRPGHSLAVRGTQGGLGLPVGRPSRTLGQTPHGPSVPMVGRALVLAVGNPGFRSSS